MAHRLSHDSGEYIDPAGREYKVLEKIQSGGMGTVYRVRKESTGNMFAAKECDLLDDLKGRGLSRQDALEIFRREGRYLEQLNFDVIPRGFLQDFPQSDLRVCRKCGNVVDPGEPTCPICQVDPSNLYYHPQQIETRTYIFMDFIDGEDLDERATSLSYPLDRAEVLEILGWLKSVAEALSYIHSKNFVYRDLKPANIRIRKDDGKVFLLDFGLLRQERKRSQVPARSKASTAVLGTEGYAPREQVRGEPVKSSDIFSLAMTAVRLLSGLDPEDPNERDRILKTAPRDYASGISPELADLIRASLRQDPSKRPSADKWVETLQGLRQQPRQKPAHPSSKRVKSQLKARGKPKGRARRSSGGIAAPNRSESGDKVAMAVLGLFLLAAMGVALFFLFDFESHRFEAQARDGAIIYSSIDRQTKIRELKGGEKLEVSDAGSEKYMLQIHLIDGSSSKGYIPRKMVDIYEQE